MSTFKIVKSANASRCEICHQSDCYNPVTNICQRCSNNLPGHIILRNSRQIRSRSALLIRSKNTDQVQSNLEQRPEPILPTATIYRLILFAITGFILTGLCIYEISDLKDAWIFILVFAIWGGFGVYTILNIAE